MGEIRQESGRSFENALLGSSAINLPRRWKTCEDRNFVNISSTLYAFDDDTQLSIRSSGTFE